MKGKIASAKPLVSRTAHGRGYIAFSRFDTKAKRWKRVSRYSKDAKTAFTAALPLQQARRVARHGRVQAEGRLQGLAREGAEAEGQVARGQRSEPAISAASCATSVGVRPTRTPLASSASCLAAAVPAVPETIAPAWPIVLPGGAVKPAM